MSGLHVVLAGGGTAGHIEPALATADALRRIAPDVTITALGTTRGLETMLVPARGYPLELVPAVPMPRRPTPDLLRVPARVRGAVKHTVAVLEKVGADVVVGFGGYVAVPAYLAARRRGTPIVVHEANARAGLANRLGARLTTYVAAGAHDSSLPHAREIGIPLRRSVSTLDRAASRAAARVHFGLDPDAPALLVFGGSQGARTLNLAAAGAASALAGAGVQVLHAAGPKNTVTVPGRPGDPPYVVVPYLERIDLAYAAADLALCRAGAMTCAELTAVGLPAGYVPFPHGNGEQRLHAEPVVAAGGGVLVEDAKCDPAWVTGTLIPLLTDPARLAAMSKAATGLGHRDADEALAAMVLAAAASRS
ncbi:MAG: UDP-N-acetylglucosamine--N-acetylmuramyl-(pentapeptide) pyrophosphoryl-undecaprenol [Mycobacteriales bacterium]|jgi:UDP-N-acetylglucosamine--N-acetylmuramyl-(pentapeptide) pyrophosphoryl-undecaprenol N-acetylglucosamine transferase